MEKKALDRNSLIVKFAAIGLAVNLILSVLKITSGLVIGSRAITLDGINSLTDSVSCAFIIVSAFLAKKHADKAHPFGYGRLEYVFSLMFAILIMYFGVRSIVEAIKDIIEESTLPNYGIDTIILMIVSLASKIGYGLVARKKGKEIRSPSLIMSGVESIGDSLASVSILVGMLVQKIFSIGIENYLCILIAIMIIRTGYEMMHECFNKILGMRVDPEFGKKIRTMIIMQEGVLNIANLVIHDYGEGTYIGSVDIQVDENLTALQISRISADIKAKAIEMGLNLTSVGVNAVNLSSHKAENIRDKVLLLATRHKSIDRIESLNVDLELKSLSFSVVPEFDVPDTEDDLKKFENEISKCFPDMKVVMSLSIKSD
ncbi:MAG: cation transporter [Spirochaetales bacterium]|nr:cation transporter [Spirochaetales bacterium]